MTSNSQSRMLHEVALRWLQDQLCVLPMVATQSVRELPADFPLSELPGNPGMRELYAALRNRGVELPPLYLSRSQHVTIVSLALLASAAAAMNAAAFAPLNATTALEALGPGLLTWAALALFAKLFLARISSAETIGELAAQILAKNPMYFSRLSGLKLSRELIQEVVINILIDACSVDRDDVTLDTPLVQLTD